MIGEDARTTPGCEKGKGTGVCGWVGGWVGGGEYQNKFDR